MLRAKRSTIAWREGVLIFGPSTPWLSHNPIQRNKGAGLAARDGATPVAGGKPCSSRTAWNWRRRNPMDTVTLPELFPGRTARREGSEEMIAPASRKIGKYEIRPQARTRRHGRRVPGARTRPRAALVALKLIEHAADADTRDSIEAERRGAELQARLAAIDPRVVRIYDAGDADGFFFVAMEYIDGQDLAELMRRGPLAPEFAADTAIAVAQTLENAHSLEVNLDGKDFHGIVHGDIKPKNIRIDARGEVRVLDFGIAKALSLSRRLTRNEFGSVPYASPERLDIGEVSAARTCGRWPSCSTRWSPACSRTTPRARSGWSA